MSPQTLSLTPDLYTYLRNYSLREPEILQELRRKPKRCPVRKCKLPRSKVSLWRF